MTHDSSRRGFLAAVATSLFIPPDGPASAASGSSLSRARWHFYHSGTTAPASVYKSAARDVVHANPVVADSGGAFPNIFLDPDTTYRAVLTSADGAALQDLDPYDIPVSQSQLASSGFTLIKHKRPEPDTYARTAAQMETMGMFGPGLSVLHWISPDFDEAILNRTANENFGPAIHAALARAAALGRPLEIVGYLTSADPIVIDRFETQVIGRGQAFLANINRAMTRPFVTVDGSGQAALSAVIEGLNIHANGIATAMLFRRPHRSTFSRISIRDCSGVAARIEGSVDDKFYRVDVADKGRPFGAIPEKAFLLTHYVHGGDPGHSQSVAHCAHVTMEHCRVNKASVAGWDLVHIAGSRLTGASSEGLTGRGVGMISRAGSSHNRITGMWFEGNHGGDLIEYGRHNTHRCVFGSRPRDPGPYLTPRSVTVKGGAQGIRFDQSEIFTAEVETGAVGTIFEPLDMIYNDPGAFVDRGTGTEVRGRRMGSEAEFIPNQPSGR